jgi:hypothetical protein
VTKSCSLLAAAGAHAKQGARFPTGLARRSWRPLVFVPTVDSAPADLLPLGFLAEFSVPARSQHQLTRLDFPFVRAGGVSHVSQRCCFFVLGRSCSLLYFASSDFRSQAMSFCVDCCRVKLVLFLSYRIKKLEVS